MSPQEVWESTSGYDLLALDPEYTGSCPCATYTGGGVRIEMNCWRTGQYYLGGGSCGHRGACVHLWGADETIGHHVKRLLDDMDWYGEWELQHETEPWLG